MPWDVEYTDEFGRWWDTLSDDQQDAIRERVDLLGQHGPALKRPTVGEIKTSAYAPRMKELRVEKQGTLRILFVFDPRRTVILLLGGDKSGGADKPAQWKSWYRQHVPEADDLYRTYLQELRDEGLIT